MKRPWTQLVKLNLFYPRFVQAMKWEDLNEFGKQARFNEAFLKHHRNACEQVFAPSGTPLGVIYYTPYGLENKHVVQDHFFDNMSKAE